MSGRHCAGPTTHVRVETDVIALIERYRWAQPDAATKITAASELLRLGYRAWCTQRDIAHEAAERE